MKKIHKWNKKTITFITYYPCKIKIGGREAWVVLCTGECSNNSSEILGFRAIKTTRFTLDFAFFQNYPPRGDF